MDKLTTTTQRAFTPSLNLKPIFVDGVDEIDEFVRNYILSLIDNMDRMTYIGSPRRKFTLNEAQRYEFLQSKTGQVLAPITLPECIKPTSDAEKLVKQHNSLRMQDIISAAIKFSYEKAIGRVTRIDNYIEQIDNLLASSSNLASHRPVLERLKTELVERKTDAADLSYRFREVLAAPSLISESLVPKFIPEVA